MAAEWVPEPRPDVGKLRAGHADRERAIDVLKAAFAEGRLNQDEYVERVGQVHASRTYGELAVLTADLPAGPLGSLVSTHLPLMTPQAGLPAPADWEPPQRPEPEGNPAVSGLALVSLLCAFVALLVPTAVLAAVPAALGGWIALMSPGRRGLGMATAAIVIALLAFWRAVAG
jgi:Domain of unknown function (DUF1707)